MKIMVDILQLLLLILGAPLVRGIIARFKARLQKRRGASIWRPYVELFKLLRKEDLTPPTSSAVFRLAPVLLFGCTVCVAAFIPVAHVSALLGSRGDFFLLVYLLGLGRFSLSLGALDGGSAFGGMGASREALISSLAEVPFLMGLVALAILSSRADITGMVAWTLHQNIFNISTVHILAFTSLAMVVLAETGRMPVDNPTTHLELTMIHEGMLLEYSGPSLALIEWASAIKLHAMLALLIALFGPWGMAAGGSGWGLATALLLYCAKVTVLMVLLSVIESAAAKLRMYLVPDFLGVASAVSALAVIFTMWVKR
ncbi:MAG TPA: NADH-quinone oxidoreductase subunit H [Candidatus Dormibacteraeota bacterium]|nr:NADH-quinone oxidoreductase subunit H [Candidatus Dormibacteraeota bacterium]